MRPVRKVEDGKQPIFDGEFLAFLSDEMSAYGELIKAISTCHSLTRFVSYFVGIMSTYIVGILQRCSGLIVVVRTLRNHTTLVCGSCTLAPFLRMYYVSFFFVFITSFVVVMKHSSPAWILISINSAEFSFCFKTKLKSPWILFILLIFALNDCHWLWRLAFQCKCDRLIAAVEGSKVSCAVILLT